jgi:hypothetical protein
LQPRLLPDGTPDVHYRTARGGQKLRDVMLDGYIDLYGPYVSHTDCMRRPPISLSLNLPINVPRLHCSSSGLRRLSGTDSFSLLLSAGCCRIKFFSTAQGAVCAGPASSR